MSVLLEQEDCDALTSAFSGFEVDEKLIISIAGKWKPEQNESFKKAANQLFSEDDHHHVFERWETQHIALLEREFARFKKAVVLWMMHPWERDARMAKEALMKGPILYNVIIEIACTRSSEELLGARKAYHFLFHHSIEEDIASHVTDITRNLLVALVSSYRYEGPHVNEEIAKSKATTLGNAIKSCTNGSSPIENEHVLRILTTRSKPCLRTIFNYYKQIYGKTITHDLEEQHEWSLKESIACLCTPQTYFSELLDMAMKRGRMTDDDEHTTVALIRIIVCRAHVDMKETKDEYQNKNGVSLSVKIEETTCGSFKDFLLTLVERED